MLDDVLPIFVLSMVWSKADSDSFRERGEEGSPTGA